LLTRLANDEQAAGIDGAGSATCDHDAAGRVMHETRSLDGITHTFARSFDRRDRLLAAAGNGPIRSSRATSSTR
jgi:hypothetical protein